MSRPEVVTDDVLDLVRAGADDVERDRRILGDVLVALRGTGINRLWIPAVLGGLQADAFALMDAAERLAAADGSTAWCAVIGSASNLPAGYMPEAGARRVFADPDLPSATMLTPLGRITCEGGRAVLNGRWPFTSNCLHGKWIGLSALIERPDGLDPVPRVAFVRSADLVIEDTWGSVGLRDTGSHHVTANQLTIDIDQCSVLSGPSWPEGLLWRLPPYTVMLPALTSVVLGIARGALDEIARQAREGRAGRRGQLTDDPMSMADYGVADTRLRSARVRLWVSVEEARQLAAHHLPVPRTLQAQIALACLHATETSMQTTAVAHRLGGGAAYTGNRLLRAFYDVEAASRHYLFSRQHLAVLATISMGLDSAYPPFVV
jgi:alkylation response protein AidB-like acyl-CoA dehydrogenase